MLLSLAIVILISIGFLCYYTVNRAWLYFALEIVNFSILHVAIHLLVRGHKDAAARVLFPVYSNFYLLKMIIFPIFINFEIYPYFVEIYYPFQILVILATGYFCRNRIDIWITLICSVVFNIIILINNHQEASVYIEVYSKIMFLIIPTMFAFHIYRGKQNLKIFYKTNINKNREINHRVKNQLSLLKSMIHLKKSDGNPESEMLKEEIDNTITSFIKIYDRLLHSELLNQLNLFLYIKSIIDEYSQNLLVNCDFRMDDESYLVDAEKSTHIGMIISELFSNSIKHAGTEKLNITIEFKCTKEKLHIMFSDNGRISEKKKSDISFGQAIITTIVKDTLKGDYQTINEDGYKNVIIIPHSSLSPLQEVK